MIYEEEETEDGEDSEESEEQLMTLAPLNRGVLLVLESQLTLANVIC